MKTEQRLGNRISAAAPNPPVPIPANSPLWTGAPSGRRSQVWLTEMRYLRRRREATGGCLHHHSRPYLSRCQYPES